MIASLILNTIRVYGGTISVEDSTTVHVVPSLACSDAMKVLIDNNKEAIIALLRIPPQRRPGVKGYLMWRRPGFWVWSEAPAHILATRSTLPVVGNHCRQKSAQQAELLELAAA